MVLPVGGMQPSAFTHSPIDAMLVRARTQSCSMRARSSSKKRHSLRPSGKSRVADSSQAPLMRQSSQRAATSAMQLAYVSYGFPRKVAGRTRPGPTGPSITGVRPISPVSVLSRAEAATSQAAFT